MNNIRTLLLKEVHNYVLSNSYMKFRSHCNDSRHVHLYYLYFHLFRLPSSRSRYPGRRIRFDPFALLLDASLEGDFDLVQRIIKQVPNPSQSNDEGITALHNAVCACHFNLVKFLVHYGYVTSQSRKKFSIFK